MFNPYHCTEILDIAPTLSTYCGSTTSSATVLIMEENMNNEIDELLKGTNYARKFGSKGKVQDLDGICDTLQSAMGTGGGNIPIIKEKYMNKEVGIIREESLEREGWHRNAKEVLSVDGICRTISTQSNNLATKIKEKESMRIRKLTPKECFRLMGFDDESFMKAEKVCSNTQLYKQAGNSICVPILEYIITSLFDCKALEV
jgi:DNA (cytosine-5)-methyltransferase 1